MLDARLGGSLATLVADLPTDQREAGRRVLVLAGGGAVAAVTTGGETPEVPPGIERVPEDSEGIAPLSDARRRLNLHASSVDFVVI
jgi:hypothetical protein